MRILGIDPSYTATGLVILEDHGCSLCVVGHTLLKLPPGPRRLLRAAKGLHGFIVGKGVSLVLCEDAAFGAPDPTVVGMLKELTGVYRLVVEAHDIPIAMVSPTTVKKEVGHSGRASKGDVAERLSSIYAITFDSDKGNDLSDAAGIAVLGWLRKWGGKL